jgi:signal transduction histidine kinase
VVDNAIKYAPPRSTIRIDVGRSGDGSWVAVADEGPGIAEEHRERIFERFYRIDKARSREAGGTGLGLSLAQWAVSSHGGRVEVESEVGRGSTFRLVIPQPRQE